ncbi:hypothetical protein [Mycobacterium vicinigordonae]|nr:hypothetical protein [Mycobacterium vicinigordonae]
MSGATLPVAGDGLPRKVPALGATYPKPVQRKALSGGAADV